MRSPPVLFLDIDGVLNCQTDFIGATTPAIINQAFKLRLFRIIEATNCKLVLSSSWRGIDFLETKLTAEGISVFDRTRRLSGCRGDEIKQWLDGHGQPHFVILDDDADMLPEQMSHLVKTSFAFGLTEEIADLVITKLNFGS